MNTLLGAHGTGKTTLTKSVKKHRPNIFITDGFTRPAKTVRKRLELTGIQEQILINEFAKWGYKNYINQKNVLTTRTVIDHIIYSAVLYPSLYTGKLEKLFDRTRDKIQNVFYVPIEFEIDEEGRMGKELQDEIDLAIQHFIESKDLDVIKVTGTTQERTEIILEHIDI